ncbi:MAG: hypothetical protein R3288_16145 [Woeseiaceae bacterium]|nr:hypothetical protein [Woeseiaceae bacterium]
MLNTCSGFLLLLALASKASMAVDADAAEPRAPDPLFQDHDVVEIHITAPMSTLVDERPDEDYLPATLSWVEPGGERMTVDIGIRTRGNFRRQKDTCRFPPLRVNFKKGDVKDTLFHKQDALKLVTHCRDRSDRYEQNVLKEYLIYRMLNVLTDTSYRVRLLRVRYTDTEDEDDEREAFGFFIEHAKRFGKRTGLEEFEVQRTRYDRLDAANAALTAIFHYMIGNTDYSPIAGPEEGECCHNSDLYKAADGHAYAVPYDFDMSGMVDAPYAVPNERFGLRRVTQRLYRGYCVHNAGLGGAAQVFRDKRDALYALIDNEGSLTSKTAAQMRKYLDSFYDVIDDRKKFSREIIEECRGPD